MRKAIKYCKKNQRNISKLGVLVNDFGGQLGHRNHATGVLRDQESSITNEKHSVFCVKTIERILCNSIDPRLRCIVLAALVLEGSPPLFSHLEITIKPMKNEESRNWLQLCNFIVASTRFRASQWCIKACTRAGRTSLKVTRRTLVQNAREN